MIEHVLPPVSPSPPAGVSSRASLGAWECRESDTAPLLRSIRTGTAIEHHLEPSYFKAICSALSGWEARGSATLKKEEPSTAIGVQDA